MLQDILSAIPLGFFLSVMPGAVFFVLLETSVLKGFKAAIAFDLGAITSDIIFILIAYFSSYKLLEKIKDEPGLFIFGGIIMLTYGIISFLKVNKNKNELIDDSAKDIIKNVRKDYLSLYIKGFLLNFINIGVLLFWLGIIITWGPQLDLKPSRMFVFFTAVVGTYFIIDLGKITLAKQLRSKLTTANIIKIKRGISVVLMIFGIALLVQGWFPKEMKSTINQFEKQN
ncbi:LysE family translocator [Flavobacterium subsaxonicum]|uniref:Lysine transporter LysE n=1 Tax=Flavobacterium subsaxonicum WB 4.1-42 = DSM 21790 TaxID=1121898 RepID=A0A0A2MWZ0_9FLAO|nr:LysE family transporter [Flavobacterium subsaxonicum]KGO92720.1 lysine transporter LysE [Flavobacterium subsaxonicum WB 4.1-42 = DSM 21790]